MEGHSLETDPRISVPIHRIVYIDLHYHKINRLVRSVLTLRTHVTMRKIKYYYYYY